MTDHDLTSLTAEIVAGFVATNRVIPEALPDLIKSVYGSLHLIRQGKDAETAEPKSAKLTSAQIRKSITPDAIVSFLDGKGYRTMGRHLSARGYTPEKYREEFGLSKDYPLIAASYSKVRSEMAKAFGLGAKGRKGSASKRKS